MELDRTKLQEVVEKIAYQQTADNQADDLFNKMGILNKYVQEQLALHNVSKCYIEKDMDKAYDKGFADGRLNGMTGSII